LAAAAAAFDLVLVSLLFGVVVPSFFLLPFSFFLFFLNEGFVHYLGRIILFSDGAQDDVTEDSLELRLLNTRREPARHIWE
jgi:hypothetical protein